MRMIVKVLGPGCASCQTLEKLTRDALADLALDAVVEHVTDPAVIAGYGVMRTPGLVVGEKVVVSGRLPTQAHLRSLLATSATSA